jgi:hypothetical protein
VLATPAVKETTGSSMQAAYVGQTAGLVRDIVKSAAGGILFIDEA